MDLDRRRLHTRAGRHHGVLLAMVVVLVPTVVVGVGALARRLNTPQIRVIGGTPPATPSLPDDRTHGNADRIVFASLRDGRYHLYLINPDGTGGVALTSGSTEERTPEWSPDRDRIAFARFVEPGGSVSDIYVIRADGSGLVRVTRGREVEEDPSWSPDGEQIVFTSSNRSTGRTRIRIERVDGAEAVQLPEPPAGCIDREPAWSPDGVTIAFARKCGDRPSALYAFRADGTGLALLADFGRTPDWSPDGSRLAYTGWGRYGPAIFIANLDGSERVQLTTDGTADPAWSPDGSRIAFTVGGLALRVFVIDTDGHNQRPLLDDTSDQVMPAW